MVSITLRSHISLRTQLFLFLVQVVILLHCFSPKPKCPLCNFWPDLIFLYWEKLYSLSAFQNALQFDKSNLIFLQRDIRIYIDLFQL